MNQPGNAICINVPKVWRMYKLVQGIQHPEKLDEVEIESEVLHPVLGTKMYILKGNRRASFGAEHFIVLPSMDADTVAELEKEAILM